MLLTLDMSYNATRVFPNTPRPRSYQIMEDIIMYQGAALMLFNICLLYLFRLRWLELNAGDKKRHVVLLFTGNVSFSLFLNIQAILKNSSVINYDDKLQVCVWMQKLPGLTYILSSWFLYLVLIGREQAVSEGLHNLLGDPTCFNKVCRWTVNLAAKYFIPVYALVVAWFFQGRLIWNDNACDTFIPTFTSVAMGLADSILSVLLLYLFLDPVIRVQRMSVESMDSRKKNSKERSAEINLYKVAKRNLLWSSIMILSTSLALFTLSATMARAQVDDNLDIQWWRPFAYFLGQADLFVNTVAALAIYPGAWVPNSKPCILKWLRLNPPLDSNSSLETSEVQTRPSVSNLL